MDGVLDLVSILAELFGWIGLALAFVCLVALGILRLGRGHWLETSAIVIDSPEGAQVRWMSTEGTLHWRDLDPDERAAIADPDELQIHYSSREPDRMRFEASAHGEKVLRTLLFVFGGLAVLSLVVSLVVLFIQR